MYKTYYQVTKSDRIEWPSDEQIVAICEPDKKEIFGFVRSTHGNMKLVDVWLNRPPYVPDVEGPTNI